MALSREHSRHPSNRDHQQGTRLRPTNRRPQQTPPQQTPSSRPREDTSSTRPPKVSSTGLSRHTVADASQTLSACHSTRHPPTGNPSTDTIQQGPTLSTSNRPPPARPTIQQASSNRLLGRDAAAGTPAETLQQASSSRNPPTETLQHSTSNRDPPADTLSRHPPAWLPSPSCLQQRPSSRDDSVLEPSTGHFLTETLQQGTSSRRLRQTPSEPSNRDPQQGTLRQAPPTETLQQNPPTETAQTNPPDTLQDTLQQVALTEDLLGHQCISQCLPAPWQTPAVFLQQTHAADASCKTPTNRHPQQTPSCCLAVFLPARHLPWGTLAGTSDRHPPPDTSLDASAGLQQFYQHGMPLADTPAVAL
ncbi:putative uncharacterized protein ENSP00000383309 [Homarus americanus]|uniref:putative uncharacterized protein ENSP00000383309 n=1 Tax=Homarus americanus TaxID=6706 RepID=UPI001C486850|nr:putative uncharacterized protein ENSP00000383309 [Homarus americanus]